MMKEKINGLEVIFEQKLINEKKIIKDNFIKLSKLISNLWGLNKPEYIKIFITDSDIKYSLHAYSLFQKFIILIIFPYWYIKTRKSFKTIGVIDVNAKDPSILIKSMKFLEKIKSNVSGIIYIKSKNVEERYKHGYLGLFMGLRSDGLKLPKWLGSGIGSFTSEKFLSKNIVKKETIEIFDLHNKEEFNNITGSYPHVIGYWTVKYLEENYPGFLKESFKEYKGEDIVEQIVLML